MARMTTKSRNFARALKDIEALQDELMPLVNELARLRGHHIPPAYFEGKPANRDDVARSEAEAAAIAELQERATELEEDVDQLWREAAETQDDASARLEGDDGQLEHEIGMIEERRRDLSRLSGRFVEDARDNLAVALRLQRERLDALLASPPSRPDLIQAAAAAWALRDPAFEKAMLDRINAATGYAPGPRADWQGQLDQLARQVERRRRELDVRGEERAVADAEAQLREASNRLAAVQA